MLYVGLIYGSVLIYIDNVDILNFPFQTILDIGAQPPLTLRLVSGSGPVYLSGQHALGEYRTVG